jgi:hypothetical protein
LTNRYLAYAVIAQSFSPFSAWDGWQVRRPSWIWATSLCYILLNKFVALVGSGRQTCCPSRDKKGLKDWAISCRVISLSPWYFVLGDSFSQTHPVTLIPLLA